MELTILGCSGSYPTKDTQCSGYLVRQDGFNIWMDAGNGTLNELQKHIALDELDAIVLSHSHPDHCADLYPFFYAILFDHRLSVPVYTPPGLMERLDALIGEDSKERFRTLLRWHEMEPGARAELGPFRLEAFEACHAVVANTYRLTSGDATLCYSGDTGPSEALVAAASDADLFLCEASWLEEHRGLMDPVHLTAKEAGDAARAAGVDRLVLTHIWPVNDLDEVRAQTSETFDGTLELALDLGTTKV